MVGFSMKASFRLVDDESRWITTVFGDAFIADYLLSNRGSWMEPRFDINGTATKRSFGVDDVSCEESACESKENEMALTGVEIYWRCR
jgi:hypothetical protein